MTSTDEITREILRAAHDSDHFVAFPGELHAAARWGQVLCSLVSASRVRRKPWPTSDRLTSEQLRAGEGANYTIGVVPA
jgi:hypothetical protein